MALRVITGTIVDASDPFGMMGELVEGHLLDRWYWTWRGWGRKDASAVGMGKMRDGMFKIIQPTSIGKTVLAATLIYYTYIHGGKFAGNLTFRYWGGVEIRSFRDLSELSNCHILLDDFKGVVLDWKCKAAALVGEVANAGGKKNNQIDVTAQRTTFVPPDLRELCDEVIVPWMIKVDLTRVSPRGINKGVPVEIVPLRFTAGFEFLGIGGFGYIKEGSTIRYDNGTGESILGGFDTLQISNGLKGEEVKRK